MKITSVLFALVALSGSLLPVHAEESRPGRLVIGAEAGKGVAIVDPAKDNAVLYHHKIGTVHDLHLLDNNHLLTQDGYPNIIELDPATDTVVWSYHSAKQGGNEGKKIEVHGYQRLANGDTMIAESGAARIIEVTPEGKIVKHFPLVVSEPHPHRDTRIVRKLEDGHYLVAHEGDEVLKEYDAEGKVVWEYQVPLFGKEPANGHGPEAWGGKLFSALKRANGNYLIATGNGHSVLEVTPEKEIVWKLEQNEIPGVTLAWVTNLTELPNGNLIIGNCHAGPENPQIIEITRDKELVWSFKDFETFGDALANTVVVDGDRADALRAYLAKP